MSDTRKLTKMALLVALTCVSAYISFPIPFSPAMVTATTLVLCLIGFFITTKGSLYYYLCVFIIGHYRGAGIFRRYQRSW